MSGSGPGPDPDHASEEDDDTIDPKSLIKRLAPDQVGLFEPISGLMLVNISNDDFVQITQRWIANTPTANDAMVLHAVNHETYHFAQSACSGYMFERHRRMFNILNAMQPMPNPMDDPEIKDAATKLVEWAGTDPGLRQRAAAALTAVVSNKQFAAMEARAAAGDNSFIGAMMPEFFGAWAELQKVEAERNICGISIQGLLEGSAVVHSNLVTYHGKNPKEHLESELTTLPPIYAELYTHTVAGAGDRTLELLLPTVALALRYEQPHNAYCPLGAQLANCAPGDEIAVGQRIADALPVIHDAGSILGTAVERRAQHTDYLLYDEALGPLREATRGVDSYFMLADPQAMNRIEAFPMGMVTQDGFVAKDRTMAVARMTIMALVLRVQSRRPAEQRYRNAQLSWARQVLDGLIDDDVSPDTSG